MKYIFGLNKSGKSILEFLDKINEDYKGYDYDEPRKLTASASSGIYGGKNPVSKGWAILTPKSWKSY